MDTQIVFTPVQLFEAFLALCGAIVAVSAALGVIVGAIQKAKSPNRIQNERLDMIEKRLNKFDELFDNDDKRLQQIEAGNRVTQRAILALLRHSIDGNDTEALREAEYDLNKYLIEK